MKRTAVHINDMRRILDHARIDRQPVDIQCWKSTGDIIHYKGWLVRRASWREGTHLIQNPANGEIRRVRDVCIFEINGLKVYL